MRHRSKVLCIGEIVIDLFQTEAPNTYVRLMGGSPGNTGIGLATLGGEAAVFAAVGKADPHGQFLIEEMQARGVDTSPIAVLDVPTTQSWISLDALGQRFFNFVPMAHDKITPDHVAAIDLTQYSFVHLTSVLQANPTASEAIDTLLTACNIGGIIVSFDPNLRPVLWGNTQRMVDYVAVTLPKANIVKISDEELAVLLGLEADTFLGEVDINALNLAASRLFSGFNQVFVVTLGSRGAFWKTPTGFGHVTTIAVDVVDTTGAGDAFDAGLINGLSSYIAEGALNVPDSDLPKIVRRACVFASLSTRAKGAVAGLPTADELNASILNSAQ